MSLIQGNAKKSTVSGFYDFPLEQSLRFNDDDSAYLSWTPVGTGDSQKKFTTSFWVKRANLAESYLFSIGSSTADRIFLRLDSADNLDFFCQVSSTTVGRYTTSRVFRDTSAWYHIVVAVDTSLANADSIKVYVNGERDSTNPSTNFNNQSTVFGTQVIHTIGTSSWTLGSTNCDSYLADFYCIDNAQLTASDFGETKNGVWVAKDYAGTFGTNGFYLTFEDDTQVEAFNTVLYRGNGGTQSITGVGFLPDLVWLKRRGSAVASNRLLDTVRGVQKNLYSDLNSAEQTQNSVMSFDSDGFTVGDSAGTNGSGDTFVAWCWKAGGAPTVDNSAGAGNVPTAGSVKIDGVNSTSALAGSIPATRLSASTTYGLSIVSYTGDSTGTDGTPSTVAHGLSQAPEMIMFKPLDTYDGAVYHSGLTSASYRLVLFSASGTLTQASDNGFFNGTAPTSSVFSIGSRKHTNSNGGMIAYCFHSVEGYSKFGSYEGNGSTNGPEIDCGFVPALVLIKDIGRAEHWVIFDGTRETQNDRNLRLFPSSNSVESPIPTGDGVRFLSTANGDSINGFKITTNSYGINDNVDSDVTKIYAAFADTREAAFWLDQSGNDNDWQPVNLDHNDTLLDSPTNNFATWNPLFRGGEKSSSIAATSTLSDGNLKVSVPTNSYMGATMRPTSGQYYCEATIDTVTNEIGWGWIQATEYSATTAHAGQANKWGAEYSGYAPADIFLRDETTAIAQPTITLSNGDVIQWAWDIDAGKGWIGVNNNWYDSSGGTTGNPSTGANPTFTFTADEAENLQVYVANGTGTAVFTANFGQQPFKYDPPA